MKRGKIKRGNEKGKENTEKVIKVYCKVRGIDYEKVKNPREDIRVTINEFDRFLNETVKIKVDFYS